MLLPTEGAAVPDAPTSSASRGRPRPIRRRVARDRRAAGATRENPVVVVSAFRPRSARPCRPLVELVRAARDGGRRLGARRAYLQLPDAPPALPGARRRCKDADVGAGARRRGPVDAGPQRAAAGRVDRRGGPRSDQACGFPTYEFTADVRLTADPLLDASRRSLAAAHASC